MPNHRFTLIKLMLVGLVASVLTGCASSRMMPPNFQIIPAEELSDKAPEEPEAAIAIHTEERRTTSKPASSVGPSRRKDRCRRGRLSWLRNQRRLSKKSYTIKGEVILDFDAP